MLLVSLIVFICKLILCHFDCHITSNFGKELIVCLWLRVCVILRFVVWIWHIAALRFILVLLLWSLIIILLLIVVVFLCSGIVVLWLLISLLLDSLVASHFVYVVLVGYFFCWERCSVLLFLFLTARNKVRVWPLFLLDRRLIAGRLLLAALIVVVLLAVLLVIVLGILILIIGLLILLLIVILIVVVRLRLWLFDSASHEVAVRHTVVLKHGLRWSNRFLGLAIKLV